MTLPSVSKTVHLKVAALLAGALCGGAIALGHTSILTAKREVASSVSSPATLAERADLQRQFHALLERNKQAFLAGRQKPLLPVAQRRPWIEAWNAMRECTRRRGFDGVSEVSATYGDGQTDMPNIETSRPHAAEAIRACPFVSEQAAPVARVGAAAAPPHPAAHERP